MTHYSLKHAAAPGTKKTVVDVVAAQPSSQVDGARMVDGQPTVPLTKRTSLHTYMVKMSIRR